MLDQKINKATYYKTEQLLYASQRQNVKTMYEIQQIEQINIVIK